MSKQYNTQELLDIYQDYKYLVENENIAQPENSLFLKYISEPDQTLFTLLITIANNWEKLIKAISPNIPDFKNQ